MMWRRWLERLGRRQFWEYLREDVKRLVSFGVLFRWPKPEAFDFDQFERELNGAFDWLDVGLEAAMDEWDALNDACSTSVASIVSRRAAQF